MEDEGKYSQFNHHALLYDVCYNANSLRYVFSWDLLVAQTVYDEKCKSEMGRNLEKVILKM